MLILDNFVEMQRHSHDEGAQEGAIREERMGPGHPFSVHLLPSVLANATVSITMCPITYRNDGIPVLKPRSHGSLGEQLATLQNNQSIDKTKEERNGEKKKGEIRKEIEKNDRRNHKPEISREAPEARQDTKQQEGSCNADKTTIQLRLGAPVPLVQRGKAVGVPRPGPSGAGHRQLFSF